MKASGRRPDASDNSRNFRGLLAEGKGQVQNLFCVLNTKILWSQCVWEWIFKKETVFKFRTWKKFLKRQRRPDAVRTSGRHLDAFQNLRKFDDFFNDGRMWLKNCFCVCKMKILWSINVSKKFFVFKVPRLLKPQWNFWKDEDVRTPSGRRLDIFEIWENFSQFSCDGKRWYHK